MLDQGLDPGEINARRKAEKVDNFEVWEENWQALEIFAQCQTQWRTSMSGLVGLDYTAVAWVLRLNQVEDELLTLQKLQIVEATVLKLMNGNRSE